MELEASTATSVQFALWQGCLKLEFRVETLLLEMLVERKYLSKAAPTHRVKAHAVDQGEVPAVGRE